MDLTKQDIPSLIGRIAEELSNLAKDEVSIAKIELRQSVKEAAANSAVVAMGASLIYAGLLLLLMAAMFGLATLMPIWAAAALVGVLTSAIGFLTMRFKTDISGLNRTKETLKTNGLNLKEQLTYERA